jgi:hypothetical protein
VRRLIEDRAHDSAAEPRDTAAKIALAGLNAARRWGLRQWGSRTWKSARHPRVQKRALTQCFDAFVLMLALLQKPADR